MPSLSSYNDNMARENAQKTVYVIYVEGKDDVEYLDFIYPDRGLNFVFKSATDPSEDPSVPTGGGCECVVHRVGIERKRFGDSVLNPKVLGIVDRDIYKKRCDWGSFLEADNSNFQSEIDEGVTVLRRWEIENYFADPVALKFTLARNLPHQQFRGIDEAAIRDRLIKLCESLIVISAGSIVLHEHGHSDLPPGWGFPLKSPEDSKLRVITALKKKGIEEAEAKLINRLADVKLFDCGSSDRNLRLRHMLRIVDGKRLLTHFDCYLGIRPNLWRFMASDCEAKGVNMEDLDDFIAKLTS